MAALILHPHLFIDLEQIIRMFRIINLCACVCVCGSTIERAREIHTSIVQVSVLLKQ
jgi:hypothetical protein